MKWRKKFRKNEGMRFEFKPRLPFLAFFYKNRIQRIILFSSSFSPWQNVLISILLGNVKLFVTPPAAN